MTFQPIFHRLFQFLVESLTSRIFDNCIPNLENSTVFCSAGHVLESLGFARIKPLAAPHYVVSPIIFLVKIGAFSAIEKLLICLKLFLFGGLFLFFNSFECHRVVAFMTFGFVACETILIFIQSIFVVLVILVQTFE